MRAIVIVRERVQWVRERNANAGHSVGGWTTDTYFEAEYDDGSTSASILLPPAWAPFLEQAK